MRLRTSFLFCSDIAMHRNNANMLRQSILHESRKVSDMTSGAHVVTPSAIQEQSQIPMNGVDSIGGRNTSSQSNRSSSCAVKDAWSTVGESPPGNWFAPPGSNQSSSGGNETAEASGAEGRLATWRACRP